MTQEIKALRFIYTVLWRNADEIYYFAHKIIGKGRTARVFKTICKINVHIWSTLETRVCFSSYQTFTRTKFKSLCIFFYTLQFEILVTSNIHNVKLVKLKSKFSVDELIYLFS